MAYPVCGGVSSTLSASAPAEPIRSVADLLAETRTFQVRMLERLAGLQRAAMALAWQRVDRAIEIFSMTPAETGVLKLFEAQRRWAQSMTGDDADASRRLANLAGEQLRDGLERAGKCLAAGSRGLAKYN